MRSQKLRLITKCLVVLLLLSVNKVLHGQVKPNGSGVPTVSDVLALPQANLGAKINYVRTWDAWKPITDPAQISQQNIADVKINTAYIDGQARVMQTVSKQISPIGKDMVSYKQFDKYGRETIQPLAYVSTETNGEFKPNAYSGQQYYYSTGSVNNNQYTGEQIYFGRTALETSPLGRPDTVMAPGNSWAGSNKGVRYQYQFNTTSDSVRLWTIADAAGSTPSTSSIYGEAQLYKTIVIDEHGNQVVEYKDKQGMIILKKVQEDASPGTAHVGWLCTYYIYDDYRSLRVVIQPQAVVSMLWAGNWTASSLMDELCFRYEYDQRNRMIIKKVPGAGEVHIVYDGRDRIVMTQDANLRNGSPAKWLYTKYDPANRVIATGLLESSLDRATHQSATYSSSTYPLLINYSYEQMTTNQYDNYNGVYFASFDTQDISKLIAGNNPWPETVTSTDLVYGKTTAAYNNSLGLGEPEFKGIFYDEKGRVIQVRSEHVELNHDVTTNRYDFSGKLIASYQRHNNDGGGDHYLVTIRTRMEYDHAGRVTKVWKQVNDVNEKQILLNSYDELGQLKSKKLAPEYNSNAGLETLNYEYNIRGWLKEINKNYANGSSNTNWFGQSLSYDHGFTTQQHNGNISGLKWRSKGDGEQRAYGFTYDKVNRLTVADFTQYTSSAWNTNAGIDFTANNLSYDANGNILQMKQKGWKLGGSAIIDDLAYTYNSNSNKLLKVIDAISTDNKMGDFFDGINGSNTDYTYDVNGNLIVDNNKAISSITYNHLNLSNLITVTDKGTIAYGYGAEGNKLCKQTVDAATSTTTMTTYYNGIVYKNDTLQYLPHEEGRIRLKDTSFVYDYFVKDHLGNIRVVLTDEQQTDAYPAATMESANASTEEAFYSNLPETRVGAPTNYPNISGNYKVAKLQGDDGGGTNVMIGPAIVLKVMAGDKFSFQVNSWWENISRPVPPVNPYTALLNAMSGSIGNLTGNHPTSTELQNSSELSNSVTSFLNSQTYNSNNAKAYVNWILLDERFNYVAASSGFEQVDGGSIYTTHVRNDMPIDKSGYLYICVSNASPNFEVFFDNLQVTHIRGPLVEENHYYPFGLVMKGVSSNTINFGGYTSTSSNDCGCPNKKGFNGNEKQEKEFSDGSGIDVYDFNARTYDQQIGRFYQIDPISEEGGQEQLSPYHFAGNNPILYSDPNGKCPWCVIVILVGLLTTPTPANPPSSVTNPTPADYANWEAANNNALKHAAASLLGGAGKLIINVATSKASNNTKASSKNTNTSSNNANASTNSGGVSDIGKGATDALQKAQARADKLSANERPGQDFTKAGKEATKDLSKAKNEGQMKCENCNRDVQQAQQHKKGETPPNNEAHVDHINPASNNGSGTPNNGQVLCRECNLNKGSTVPTATPTNSPGNVPVKIKM